ncbi:MAG: 3-dehydroquinate synthase, partial [Bacteroidota bacterium]
MSETQSPPLPAIRQQFAVDYRYEVLFTRGLFELANETLLRVVKKDDNKTPRKLLFLVDDGVSRCHPDLSKQIAAFCAHYSEEVTLCGAPVILPGGEACKNDFSLVTTVLEHIERQKIDRHSYVIAIGGGAILDMVGFAAAIAHRGVRHIRVPTTVLSQNDSGVGVKNSVNFFGKKNFLGTFAPAVAVLNDSDFLLTLDDRDWRAGIAEAIKVALIRDEVFFSWIERNTEALNRRDLPTMEYLIHRCAEHHTEHIATEGDPFEYGSSRPLDFGHWAAHKLEQLTDYTVRHGEAVAMGIALDVAYSHFSGRLVAADMERITAAIAALGFALTHPALYAPDGAGLRAEIWDGLEEFREHLGGELTIMLLETPGRGVEVHEMDKSLLDQALLSLPVAANSFAVLSATREGSQANE